jgi:4-hydroxy-tetrahydrodipicolinate synthase
MKAAEKLFGSITPIFTPFRNGEVDFDLYGTLIDRHVEAGGHGVLVNGTTSEPSLLSVAERNRLVDIAVSVARGRGTVVAATGSQSLAETHALSDHASKAGVDALLVVTPYYVRPPQRGLVEYYVDIAAATSLPVMVYHIPGRAAVSVTLDTLEQVIARAPNLVGMKHAVNDLAFATQCLARFGPAFRLFVGLEELSFPMLCIGACGLMNAVGNLAPRQVAELYEATARGDFLKARQLHFQLFELNQAVFFDTNPIPIKYMARRLGMVDCNEHRLPMLPATEELERRLDQVLIRAGLVE